MSPFHHVDAFLSSLATRIPLEGRSSSSSWLLGIGARGWQSVYQDEKPEVLWTSRPPDPIPSIWRSAPVVSLGAAGDLANLGKMKISFNETSLQTMFEYPSESSLAEEEEEEEEDGHASETEEDKSCTFYIPRPNSTLHPSTPNSADLSSYTPKHSVKFSEWQEQKYEEIPAAEGALPKEADAHGSQVMLTPAEKGGLSDFSSEPALYF
ncbi:hypothetical protein llap_21508 [Limosa lapponica baueri]|uniref:Phostensin/Taperin PP1-binding domain-containing protein n=1 Tax=Limosa lapponica baueri TaxID=1758121 RepID=A0A2I0T322_LIMLA|nr:hypothetical protein llap_21508 [Limosa lapponica baueri]